MKLMKCEESGSAGITNETKKKETNTEWNIIGEKRWKRICPRCKKDIFHKSKRIRDRAIKNERLCLSCSISLKNENRVLSKKTKKRLRSICRRNALNNVGKPSWNKGKSHTNITKGKIRRGIFNHLKKYGITAPRYNPNACKYFDKLNKDKGWDLQHANNGGEIEVNGYFLDAYDEERNIVVEYDENKHYTLNGKLKKKDIDRMNEICNNLKCRFYRYNENKGTLNEYNAN